LRASPSKAGKAGRIETISLPGNASMDLAWIPAGTFLMGQRAGEQDAYPNKETPQHRVNISCGFWMARTEVTKQQWRAEMGTSLWAGRERAGDDDHTPAVFISWDDARAFVEKLTAQTGRPFRLPTEAEWEYACRAGTTSRFYWGDDPNYEQINQAAWWRGNAFLTADRHARPVGLMPPNPWGLCDMSGNVSEWCQDWHWFYGDGPDTDPVGSVYAPHRVLRGGSWLTTPGQCRSSRRHHEVPSAKQSDIGFRVVCGDAPKPEPGAPVFTNVFVAGTEGVNTYRDPIALARAGWFAAGLLRSAEGIASRRQPHRSGPAAQRGWRTKLVADPSSVPRRGQGGPHESVSGGGPSQQEHSAAVRKG